MSWLTHYLHYPVAILGTIAAFVLAWIVHLLGDRIIEHRQMDARERYRERSILSTVLFVLVAVAIVVLWARLLERRGTFLGLLGAGLAIALREPLLSIAGRIAIFVGKMYAVGDRIEINKLTGDVIDVGFFYTRMMELGNWIGGDQASGRTVQFANAGIFGTPVFNYTQSFAYIWDEITMPITYHSNIKAMTEILLDVGGSYTRDFLQGAQAQLEEMKRYFLVGNVELKPQVYMAITSNWVELKMRYVVEPKKRRQAQTYLYAHVFDRIQGRDDISIASETMDLTVHRGAPADTEKGADQAQAQGGVAGAIAGEGITGKQPSDSKNELPGDHKEAA